MSRLLTFLGGIAAGAAGAVLYAKHKDKIKPVAEEALAKAMALGESAVDAAGKAKDDVMEWAGKAREGAVDFTSKAKDNLADMASQAKAEADDIVANAKRIKEEKYGASTPGDPVVRVDAQPETNPGK